MKGAWQEPLAQNSLVGLLFAPAVGASVRSSLLRKVPNV